MIEVLLTRYEVEVMDKETILTYRDARQKLAGTTIETLQSALQTMEETIITRGGQLAEPLVNDDAMTAYRTKVAHYAQIADTAKSNKQLLAEIEYFDTIAGDNIADLLGLVEDYPIFTEDFIEEVNSLVEVFEGPNETDKEGA